MANKITLKNLFLGGVNYHFILSYYAAGGVAVAWSGVSKDDCLIQSESEGVKTWFYIKSTTPGGPEEASSSKQSKTPWTSLIFMSVNAITLNTCSIKI